MARLAEFHRQQLVRCCSPKDERASRESKRDDPTRFEAKNLQAARQVPSKMGCRAAVPFVESTHHAVSSHGVHTFLHGAWL
jgi:hypothetical protein